MASSTLSFLMARDNTCTFVAISTGGDDIDGVSISAIHLFERLDM